MSAAPAALRGRARIAALAAILLLGLGLRVDYAWEGRDPVFDAEAYARIARNLEQGRGFTLGRAATQPASNYSPGLPLLVAGIYQLSGGVHERLARVALAVIGTLSVLFAYLIGRRLSGPGAGLIGAAAVAIYPALLEYQGMLMSEPLAATLLSGAVLAVFWADDARQGGPARGACRGGTGALRLLRGVRRPPPEAVAQQIVPGGSGRGPLSLRWRAPDPPAPSGRGRPQPASPPRQRRARWLVPGALLGALAMARPEFLGVAALLALVTFLHHRADWRAPLARAAILLAGVALVVAPWTIRNLIVLDRLVPISTGGGQVLFAGTYLPSEGDPQDVGRALLERDPDLVRRLTDAHLPASARRRPLAAQREAVLARIRLEQILAALAARRYPGMESDRALARMGREQLWNDITDRPLRYAGFVADKVGQVWSHGPRQVMRKPFWEAVHWALVAFALLGIAVLARRRPWEALVLTTVAATITAVCALLVASPRRTLVLLPLVAPVAGAGATWAWTTLRRLRTPLAAEQSAGYDPKP